MDEKRRDLDSYTGCIPQHMLHLLPVTQKALVSDVSKSNTGNAGISTPDLNTILQQYSTLQAAAGLANNENAKNLFGGLDPSTALLQLQLLQVFQRQHSELLKPSPAVSLISYY